MDVKLTVTFVIIAATVLVSILSFRNRVLFQRLLLSPYRMVHNNEWYRIVTHGFVHADYVHLAINMLVFYSFGMAVEYYFSLVSAHSSAHFFILYFGGMIASTLVTIVKNRNNVYYSAVGASGAVASVLFASIFFAPWHSVLFMGIIPIPGIIFAVLYVVYSSYMSRNANDNIGHDAHMYGALFGLVYPIVIHPDLLGNFLKMLMQPSFNM